MDAIEFLRMLRERSVGIDPEYGVPYFSAEGKRLRREKQAKHDGRRIVAQKRGEPVAGTGKWKYRMPKHYDCECRKCAPKPRTTQRRDAIRDQEK